MKNEAGVRIIELIEKSGLLTADVLQKALAEFEAASGVDADEDSGALFLEHLVRAQLLTPWQAGKLKNGRHKGFLLGSYKLLGHIGSGGMSTVYLAEHIHLRQRRALKILPKHRVGDSSYLERFYREARAAAALDHPNVVHAYDVGNDGDVHYFVMEYVEGSDLQKVVARRGVLSYDSAAEVARQTAVGLTHAHKAGIVHRDIKPANLLMDSAGTIKILDMGLARYTPEELERQASLTQMHDENVIGTTNYLAPEQALNSHKADARSDIYSLGCTLYYLLTGLPPFSTGTVAQRLMKHLHEDPEPLATHRPGVPSSLAAICAKMLAKKPADRYQSAEEAAGELKALRKQWLAANEGRSGSGVVLGAPGMENSGDDDLDETPPGNRDTDALRAQATSLGNRSGGDEEELMLADLDDLPNSSGRKREAGRRPGSSSNLGSAAGKKPRAVVSSTADRTVEPKASVSAAPAAPPQNDFLAELLASAGPPAGDPLAAATKSQQLPKLPRNGAVPSSLPLRSKGAQGVAHGDEQNEDVKTDIERLFRKHPGFAAAVFVFFSGLLVLGLYYMIRPSADASANEAVTTSGAQRD